MVHRAKILQHVYTSKQDYMYWTVRIAATWKQYNKENYTITIRDPQINMKCLIIFLIMDYNVLTKTCYKVQMNSKITDLDGYLSLQDLQSLNPFESEYAL